MRKLCAARRAVEDMFGISSANPFGTHCDVHGGPNPKAFVPDSKPDDQFDVDPSSVQQHVQFYFFSILTVFMLKLVDLWHVMKLERRHDGRGTIPS